MASGVAAARTVQQQHAFLDAAKSCDFQRVRELVTASPGLVNCQPAGRWSALHQAAQAGDAGTVLASDGGGCGLTMGGRQLMPTASPSVNKSISAPAPTANAEKVS